MQEAGRIVTMRSSPEEKIRLFRALVCGREDVFAERWESKAGFEKFRHAVEVRLTGFEPSTSIDDGEQGATYVKLIAELMNDARRNEMIVSDVLKAVAAGRSPVVLTERREHLEILRRLLEGKVAHLLVLHGQMGVKQVKVLDAERMAIPDSEPRVLLATGSYIGEGFDDTRLDSLFLTLPISWKGRLTQYAGRLHRRHADKREVTIFDYADTNVVMFARMFNKRCAGYKALGYEIVMPLSAAPGLWRSTSCRAPPGSPWKSTGRDISTTRTPIAAIVAKTSCCKAKDTLSCAFLLRTSCQISATSSTASCATWRNGHDRF